MGVLATASVSVNTPKRSSICGDVEILLNTAQQRQNMNVSPSLWRLSTGSWETGSLPSQHVRCTWRVWAWLIHLLLWEEEPQVSSELHSVSRSSEGLHAKTIRAGRIASWFVGVSSSVSTNPTCIIKRILGPAHTLRKPDPSTKSWITSVQFKSSYLISKIAFFT
jgi:hypothetical protein